MATALVDDTLDPTARIKTKLRTGVTAQLPNDGGIGGGGPIGPNTGGLGRGTSDPTTPLYPVPPPNDGGLGGGGIGPNTGGIGYHPDPNQPLYPVAPNDGGIGTGGGIGANTGGLGTHVDPDAPLVPAAPGTFQDPTTRGGEVGRVTNPGQPVSGATAGSSDREAAVASFYQKYLGRTASPDEIANWANQGFDLPTIENYIKNSAEGQTYAKGSNDPSTALSRIYQRYGLDPTNPGHGLAGVDYFLKRLSETNPNDLAYWAGGNGQSGRLEQEIRKALYGEQGSLIDTGSQAGALSPFTQQIRDLLMKRIAADQAPLDEQGSGIADAVNAARIEASRSQDQERKALAEQLFAQAARGGGGIVDENALRQGVQQSAERNAMGLGTLRAQLIQREYQRKADDLNNAMQQALASGDAETARQIQLALAYLQAQLTREGYGIDLAKFQQQQNSNSVNSGLNG